MQNRWTNDYFPVSFTDPVSGKVTEFGILKTCAWLKTMWDAGHVAFVANVFGSKSRDHDHATHVMDLGDTTASKVKEGSGWGGRLAFAAGGNVLGLASGAKDFAFGPDHSDPTNLDKRSDVDLIVASNMRDFGMFDVTRGQANQSRNGYVTRSLRSYFAGKRATISPTSAFARFFATEKKIRDFGDQVTARLASIPQPVDLQDHIENTDYGFYLGLQMRNLHDALYCADILNLRVAAMEFNGWDTHRDQRNEMDGKLEALLGDRIEDRNGNAVQLGAMKLLYDNLSSSARANLVFVLEGEFGRQLRSNGDGGTDHGVGNLVILIGDPVRGGVYGDMFPESEVAIVNNPRNGDPDIKGLTAIDWVYGRACDWVSLGSKARVFPSFASKPIETGLNLNNLLV
jgi:uncharacterized protein (DUF1501 family)